MWIKRIELMNFGPHEHLDLELQQGLVGVVGPNGAGKSHILDAAYAALTGDFSGFHGVKADNIRDTAGDDEPSYVRMEAEHDGVEFVVYRGLRPNKQQLEVDGRTTTRAPDIQRELEERLGVDRQLLSRYVFVGQHELHAWLSDTPGDRAAAFQRLCGTGKAQQVHDAITDLLSQDEALNTTVTDDSDDLRRQLQEVRDRIAQQREVLREAQSRRLSQEKEQEARDTVQRHKRHGELTEQITEITAEIEQRRTLTREAARRLTAADRDLQAADAQYADLESRARQAERDLERLEAYNKHCKTVSQLRAEIQQLVEQIEADTAPARHPQDEHLESLRQRAADARREVESLQDEVDSLGKGGQVKRRVTLLVDQATAESGRLYGLAAENRDPKVSEDRCEVQEEVGELFEEMCGELADPSRIEALREKVEQRAKDAKEARRTVNRIEEAREAQKEHKHRQAVREERLAGRRRVLEDLLETDPVEAPSTDEDTLRQTVRQRDQAKREASEMREAAGTAREEHARAEARLESSITQRQRLRTELETCKVDAQQAQDAVCRLEAHREAQVDTARCESTLESLQGEETNLDRRLDQLKVVLDRCRRARRFRRMMEAVQGVMHRQALPRVVAQANLRGLESDINRTLDQFGSPFWVEASDDLTFDVHFPGAPPRPANRLSGGQQSVLSVAFRTAVSQLFGAEIGMMSLDEPTASLDADNIEFLAEAMTRFAGEIRGRRQVIMITHADALRSAFDQVAEIGTPVPCLTQEDDV